MILTKLSIELLKQKADALEAAQEELRKTVRDELKPLLQEFLKEHPEVGRIQWTQYTPHFNDGEPCEFTLGEIYFVLANQPNIDEDDDVMDMDPEELECVDTPWYGEAKYKEGSPYSEATWKACIELEKVMSKSEDGLACLFGDGYEIKVTADGVFEEYYDHD